MASDDLFDRIEGVFALEKLSSAGVGGALKLRILDDESLDTAHFEIRIGVGELGEVELRLPKATARAKDGLLIVKLNEAQQLASERVVARLGPPQIAPRGPGGPPVSYYRYPRPEGLLSFKIDDADQVVGVIVDRTGV